MGACYNTILVPAAEREAIVRAIDAALQLLGHRIVATELSDPTHKGFQGNSNQVIFVGTSDGGPWTPVSSWGEGLNVSDWYRDNPLARGLSASLSPVVYLFSHNAGRVAGYSVFEGGRLVESQSAASRFAPPNEIGPPLEPPQRPSRLGTLINDAEFEFAPFVHCFSDLEVSLGELASRLGAPVHLIDPLDVADGDGVIVLRGGEYHVVRLPGWFGIYYETLNR